MLTFCAGLVPSRVSCLAPRQLGLTLLVPLSFGVVAMVVRCKSCDKWYGSEDEGYGPCSIKHMRGDKQYITHALHECDEIQGGAKL
ncbi:MAG: hypothetical protein DRO11_07280 [Methanobacteriota archaeon]|nr:MAG: hypothetical protein DRO11_07280 [Euryarchaeota archaeon]